MAPSRRPVALFVSSSGGVLLDLLAFEPELADIEIVWAVVRAPDTETALRGRRPHWITDVGLNRPWRLIGNTIRAARLLSEIRPDLIVSAGSGPAFPFFLLGRLRRITTFWVSTLNMHDREYLTARICARLTSYILVQQQSLLRNAPRAVLIGELY